MNWLSPAFLLAGAAIILPLALHLLRRRVTRTVPFPALRFLTPNQPRARRQNFYRRLVLALRCLALLALAAAFARPFFGTPEAPVRRATVVVVDNSYSLQAGERWTDLVRWSVRAAGDLRTGDTLGILMMNPRPTWLVAPTRDTAGALRALEALRPGWQATRAEPALRLAGDILAASAARQRRIVFLGDQQALGWSGADFAHPLPPGVEILWPPPADSTPARQAAIGDLLLRRDGDHLTADVTIRNFTADQQRSISILANGAANQPAVATVALPAGATTTTGVPLPGAPASIKWVRAELDADDLPADDVAWAVAPAPADARNLVLLDRAPSGDGAPADYVLTAFQALAQLPPALRLGPATSAEWPPRAVAVLRAPASFADEAARKLDALLAAGGSALVFVNGDTRQLRWLAGHGIVARPLAPGSARLNDWTIEHPLVAPLAQSSLRSLVGWTFAHGWSFPADAVDPIASWADGSPALGEFHVGAGRVVLAGFSADRRDGDWPVAPAFVPFLHRAALYLLDLSQPLDASAARVGMTLDLPPGQAVWQALDGPAAGQKPVDVSGSITPEAPGLYRWTRGAETRLYAVNVPPGEGDLSPWPEGHPWEKLASSAPAAPVAPQRQAELAAVEAEQQSPLWWWCFAALALFLLAELPLANRTTR